MIICKNCGKEFDEKYDVCPYCETAVARQLKISMPQDIQPICIKRKNNKKMITILVASGVVLVGIIIALIMIFSQIKADSEFTEQVSLGEKYLTEKKYDESINAFEKAVELKSDDPDLYIKLANAYIAKGDNDNAVTAFQKAVKLKSDDPDLYIKLANVYISKDDNDNAISILKNGYEKIKNEKIKELLDSLNVKIIDSGSCGDNVKWKLDENGLLTISGSGKMWDYAYEYPLCSNKDKIKKVIIKSGVTNIGRMAFFECLGLTSVSMSDSVENIGIEAFKECRDLTSISISNNVTSIKDKAFDNCIKLKSITIPNSVTSIEEGAFGNCENLTSINVDSNNKNYSSKDGVLFNKNKTELICCPNGKSGEYIIPSGVTHIGESAFLFCRNLTSVSMSNSVASIGMNAFDGCDKLTSVNIPNSVTSIGDYAFGNCENLTSINVDSNNKNYSSEDGVLFNKNKTKLICCPNGKSGEYIIPNGVTSIHNNAFDSCDNLTNITIPNSVISIGDHIFSSCDKLTSIIIPDSIKSISTGAFDGCDNLKSITISSNVTSIENWAFCGCKSLTNISIPNSVTSIGVNAFDGCNNLTSITIPNNVKGIEENAFNGWTASQTIYINGRSSAPSGWNSDWKNGCEAKIVWNA